MVAGQTGSSTWLHGDGASTDGERKVVDMVDGLLLGAGVARRRRTDAASALPGSPPIRSGTPRPNATIGVGDDDRRTDDDLQRHPPAYRSPPAHPLRRADCDPVRPRRSRSQRTGTLNLAVANVDLPQTDNDPAYFATACRCRRSTLQAQITNDNGGTPGGGRGHADGQGRGDHRPHRSPAAATGAVGTDALTLAGSDVAGYTKSAFACTGASEPRPTRSPSSPARTCVCTINYDDVAPASHHDDHHHDDDHVHRGQHAAADRQPRPAPRRPRLRGRCGIGGLLLLLAGIRRPRRFADRVATVAIRERSVSRGSSGTAGGCRGRRP